MKKILIPSLFLLWACQTQPAAVSTSSEPSAENMNTGSAAQEMKEVPFTPPMHVGNPDATGATDVSQSEQFESKSVNDQETLIDTQTQLQWVNDPEGCFAGIIDMESKLCDDLDFGGHSDWRSPNQEELSQLFKAVKGEGIRLRYINTSCAVGTASDGHVFTENTEMAGQFVNYKPENAGLRCVRDM